MSKNHKKAPKNDTATENTIADAVAIDANLDAELNELMADATAVTVIEPVAEAANDGEVDLESLEAAAFAEETKTAVYAEQAAEEIEDLPAPVASDDSAVTPITAAKTPRVKRAVGSKPSAVLEAMNDETFLKVACLLTTDDPTTVDGEAVKTTVDSLAKKIGDKALNLLRFNETGDKSKLQVYTRLGLDFLLKNGTMDSKALTAHFQATKYSLGTARSQANQIMGLLPAMKVGLMSGRAMSINPDSAIVAKLV